MDWKKHIKVDPDVMFGKPFINGTRVLVDIILNKLAAGKTIEQLLKSYPHLKAEDISTCHYYAAKN